MKLNRPGSGWSGVHRLQELMSLWLPGLCFHSVPWSGTCLPLQWRGFGEWHPSGELRSKCSCLHCRHSSFPTLLTRSAQSLVPAAHPAVQALTCVHTPVQEHMCLAHRGAHSSHIASHKNIRPHCNSLPGLQAPEALVPTSGHHPGLQLSNPFLSQVPTFARDLHPGASALLELLSCPALASFLSGTGHS